MNGYSLKIRPDSILFFIILILFAIIVLPISDVFQKDFFVGFQFVIIGIVSILQMVKENDKHFYSLNLTHWFFIYTFMFSAGVTQFANDTFRWDFYPTIEEVFKANNIVILWCILYSMFFHSFRVSTIKGTESSKGTLESRYSNSRLFLFGAVLLVLSCVTLYYVDFKAFFVRSLYESSSFNKLFNSSAISSISLALTRGLSLWIAMISLSCLKKKKNFSNFVLVVISLLCSLVLVPPLGVARYVLACFYGGLSLFYFDFFKKRNIFIYALFFGLLVVFPMLNAFRGLYTTTITTDFIKKSVGNIRSNFSKADYDSYTMLVYSIRYCAKNGITWGKQSLGVLLFFVPRRLWHLRPEGSGSLIIETMATTTVDPNVSCPLIAEGYMNWGILGVALFSFFFAVTIKKIDIFYHKVWKYNSFWGQMFYSYLVFYLVFLLRGDLMSTFSSLCGYFVSFTIVKKVIERKTL